jgi:epoxyqueuosine reductase
MTNIIRGRDRMKESRSVFDRLDSEGCLARVISVSHLDELRKDLDILHADGFIDESLFQERLKHFTYEIPNELPDARFIVVATVPQPMYTLTFHWKGRNVPVILPPTYADGDEIDGRVKGQLIRAMGNRRFRLCKTALPLKILATRSGLASYGRNNITYVGKFGSFHRLTAFYTDYPFADDHWQEREALTTCGTCTACIDACPTRAIVDDRFLVRAERCLSYLNEMTADHAFPDWVKPEWHNAIAGCMHCQKICPHNSTVLNWSEEREEFDEQETEYLLAGQFDGERASNMDCRLKSLGLDLTIFPRNLAALLEQTNRFNPAQLSKST